MKKNFVLLLFPFLAYSQSVEQKTKIISQTNTTTLRSISQKSKIDFLTNKTKAITMARIYNWPLHLEKAGSWSELVGVTADNLPIYYTTFNLGAGITSRANKLYTGGTLGLNINGEDMMAGVWDAGAAKPNHELFSGRVHVLDNTIATHYHSTHVAGTIMGSDQVQNGLARGMAYKASVNSYDWNEDISEVAAAAAEGLLISNHSYGRNPFTVSDSDWGKYDSSSQSYDDIMFAAPFYQFVCAAGNSRGSYNTIKGGYDVMTGHSLSKNGIAVAAVNEVLDYTGPGSVGMSSFSSWGPTDDGRIKPDISAKGVDTFSATDSAVNSYGTLSGTSMASPSVAGTLLLYQQYYEQVNGVFMKASTLRGLMIHTADEAGTAPGPDYGFGWGLINAEKAADIITKNHLQAYIQENTLTQGDSYAITVNSLGGEPLLATLCWTDPKGNIPDSVIDNPAPRLVNDLDIRITQNTATHYPWKLDVAHPANAATQEDNIVDNVEKVEVNNPVGSYTITVTNKGTLANNTQNYSLIISGIAVKDFWLSSSENSKSICDGTNAVAYAFDLHTKSNFNEIVTFSTVNLPAGVVAVFSPPSMTAAGSTSINLSNLNTLSPGIYAFTVTATTSSQSYEMPVTLSILSPVFAEIVLTQPSNNASSTALPVVFKWQDDVNAEQYEVEIASNTNFTNVIQATTVNENQFTCTLLANSTNYFWRVRPKNRCGSGNFSDVFAFSTVCGLPTAITQLTASTTTATIGWTENSGASSWEVEVVPEGIAPTGTGIAIVANPYLMEGLATNTCYDFYIRSNCAMGNSNWTKYTFCTQPDYCGGDHFYDSGGVSGNYPNFENKTTVIYPENPGDRVKAVFNSFQLDQGWDYLRIYNGPNSNAPLLFSGTGSMQPGNISSTHPTGALTFVFTSDYVETYSGWDATIICEPMPACPSDPTAIILIATTYTSATLGWTENLGSSTWQVQVVSRGSLPDGIFTSTSTNPFTKTGLVSNSYYDFYVRSVCAAGTSGWTGPFPFNTMGNYCAGDHFYDVGGPAGNCPVGYKTSTLYPTGAGNRVKVVFNDFDLTPDTYFNVYNGPDNSYPLLFSNSATEPTTLKSTHYSGALTFEVAAYDSLHTGWDASVICEPLPPCPSAPTNLYLYSLTTSSATFSWWENSGAALWEIEIVLHNTMPTGIGTVTSSNPYTKNGLISNTWYNVYVRSYCGNGNSDWSAPFTFNTDPNYCAGDHFYDAGGPTSDYPQFSSNSFVISPAANGDRVKAIFNSFDIGNASFIAYNGPGSGYPVLFTSNGSNAPGTLTATNPMGSLYFYFYSYSMSTTSGWDASIVCEPLPPCSNPPGNIYLYGLTATTANFSWQENSNATSWEVEIVPHGVAPTGVGIITTTNPYLKSGLTSNTWYDFYVRSRCGTVNSVWIERFTFHTSANYCSGDHFYDSSGPVDNYPAQTYENITIYPTNAGDRIVAVFNSFQLNNGANFSVYNGTNSNSPLLFSGNTNPGTLTATNQYGALTFVFSNYNPVTASGWDAAITCEPLPPCSNGPTNIYLGTTTTTTARFSWNENSNAASWEVEIVPHGATATGVGTVTTANPYTKTGLTSNTWYDFYVRSKCGSVNSVWASPFTFNTNANYCQGDHFYDAGGPNSNYPRYQYNTTVIAPTATGDRVKAIFNSFQLISYDYFNIYNGPNSNAPLLFSYNGSNAPGTIIATNTAGSLTFAFSAGSSTATGWDATIICETLPPCSGQPDNTLAYNTTTSSATLSWRENSLATSWEVEIVPHGVAPTGSGIVTANNPYTKNGLASDTWYDFYVRSRCGSANSTWSGPKIFNTAANYCSGDHFYDSAGPAGNYPAYEYKTTVITPTFNGDRIKAIFNTFDINDFDSFYVYNGPDTSYPLIFSGNGNNAPGTLVSTDISGALTFSFSSSFQTGVGWDASITCEPMPECTFSPSNFTAANIMMHSATLGWTENSNAFSWEIEIVPHNTAPTGNGIISLTNQYAATGLAANTCYDAYVRSVCGSALSLWATPFPFCSQPDYCSGNHFYDSGGPGGSYQDYENKTTVIYPQVWTDKVKVIFYSFELESGYDYLRIFNGPSAASTLLFSGSGTALPPSYTSTHPTGALTFVFTSDGSAVRSGWDAAIECQVLATTGETAVNTIQYYPNPVDDILHIKSGATIVSYQIFDINSRLILTNKVDRSEFGIKMNQVSAGTYFIKLYGEHGISNIMIIKR